MKRLIATTGIALMLLASPAAFAMESHSTHGTAGADEMPATGAYEHKMAVDGIRTEFQIMSLADMKMKDPNGATHHVMLKLFDEKMNHPVDGIQGKIKVIAPSGAEQVAPLTDYSGTYAANFTFTESGNYGVICLFKKGEKSRVAKFWYPHH
ncbi:MAG: hypothetical protein ABIL58_06930 [Pseudomonadota bacterium]